MAEIVIKVKTEGGEQSVKTIAGLKDAIKTLEEEAANLDLGSDAYQEQISQVEALKKKLQELGKTKEQLAAEDKARQDKAVADAKKASDAIAKEESDRVRHAEEAVARQAERAERLGNNVQKFAAGIADAFAGALIAFGATEENAAKLNATLQQGVGIALGVKGGIEAIVAGVQLAGPAFEAFNAIIAANPIGAVVLAVVALTAAVYGLVKAFEDEERSLTSVNDSLRRNKEAHIENEKELKKIALEKGLREKTLSQEQYDRGIAEIELSDKIRDNAKFTADEIVKLYKKYGFDINKEVKNREKQYIYDFETRKQIYNAAYDQEQNKINDFNKELRLIQKAALDKTREDKSIADAKAAEATDKVNDAELDKKKEANKKLSDEYKAFVKQFKADYEQSVKDQFDKDSIAYEKELEIKIDQAYELSQVDQKALDQETERKAQADADKLNASLLAYAKEKKAHDDYQEGLRKANKIFTDSVVAGFERIGGEAGMLGATITQNIGNALDTLTSKTATTIDKIQAGLQAVAGILQAIDQYQQAQAAAQVEQLDAQLAANVTSIQTSKDNELFALSEANAQQLANESLTAEQKNDITNSYNAKKKAIEDKAALDEYNLKLANYNRETEIKKKAFEQDKKLKIATAIIQTISGVLAAVTGMISAIPGPGGIIAGAIAGVAVAALGAIQIAQISKTKFDAGSPPAAPNISVPLPDSSASGNAAQQGPQLFAINGDTDNNGQGNGQRKSNNNDEPIRAYVVTEDVTSSQNKAAVIERRRSF